MKKQPFYRVRSPQVPGQLPTRDLVIPPTPVPQGLFISPLPGSRHFPSNIVISISYTLLHTH